MTKDIQSFDNIEKLKMDEVEFYTIRETRR